jgi:hypothetical protein
MKGRRGLSKGKSQREGANPRGERRPAGDSRVRGIDRPRGESFAATLSPGTSRARPRRARVPAGPEPIPSAGYQTPVAAPRDGSSRRAVSLELELFIPPSISSARTRDGSPGARSELVVRHVPTASLPGAPFSRRRRRAGARERRGTTSFRRRRLGAGFPGIPLAIAFPEIEFVSLSGWQAMRILENCVAILGSETRGY